MCLNEIVQFFSYLKFLAKKHFIRKVKCKVILPTLKKIKWLLYESIRDEITLGSRKEPQTAHNRLVLNLSRQEAKNKLKIDLVVELAAR